MPCFKNCCLALLSLLALTSPATAQVTCPLPEKQIQSYPLLDSLLKGRSRRFFKGASMPGGPLEYDSQKSPARLSEKEEALMAFAVAGITGHALADLPFHDGRDGNGNVMINLRGRTVGSADGGHYVSVFVINDEGTYLLRRPQDMTPEEAREVIALTQAGRFVEAYHRSRIQISSGRTTIPQDLKSQGTFNLWSANKEGATYFLPMVDMTSIYMAVTLSLFDEDSGVLVLDDRDSMVSPAGLDDLTKSNGGHLNDDPATGMLGSITAVEFMATQMASIEIGGMMQNLRLMAQALGLGGFPHFAGAPGVWGEALGFERVDIPSSKLLGMSGFMSWLARLFGKEITVPTYTGLKMNGEYLLRPLTPPNFDSMDEAVQSFVDHKLGKSGTLKDPNQGSAWKDDESVKDAIPQLTAPQVEAMKKHATYVFEKYGRYPPNNGPLVTATAFQAHVLDPDFYDEFYKEGVLTQTHMCRSQKEMN